MPAHPGLSRNCREATREQRPAPHSCTGCEGCECHRKPMPSLWFRQQVAERRAENAQRRAQQGGEW